MEKSLREQLIEKHTKLTKMCKNHTLTLLVEIDKRNNIIFSPDFYIVYKSKHYLSEYVSDLEKALDIEAEIHKYCKK